MTALPIPALTQKDRERFHAKVREGDNGCRIWTGAKSGSGYGAFYLRGTMFRHYVAFAPRRGRKHSPVRTDAIVRDASRLPTPQRGRNGAVKSYAAQSNNTSSREHFTAPRVCDRA